LEYRQTEALLFDNGRLKQATFDTSQGFGLRAVKGEAVGYAHASDLSDQALARAADAVSSVRGGYSGTYAQAPARTNVRLYGDENPLAAPGFDAKVRLLETIDAYARAKDKRVRQVSVSLGASLQVVEILRADGETYRDIRPLVRVNVSVVAGVGGRRGEGGGGSGAGGKAAPRARGGAKLTRVSSRPMRGTTRRTRRFARHSPPSRRSRRPPARWTWCSAPAGPA